MSREGVVLVSKWTCAFCGGPDSRHRVVDAQMERFIAGESMESVAADWDVTPVEMVKDWSKAYGRALAGWTKAVDA